MIENNNILIAKIKELGIKIVESIDNRVLLVDISNISLGGTPSRKKDEYWNGEYKWINSGEMTNNPVITTESEKITKLGIENSSTQCGKCRDTVISIIDPDCNKISLLSEKYYFNQSVICLSAKNENQFGIIYFSIINEMKRLKTLKNGAAQQSLNKTIFINTSINYDIKYSDTFNTLVDSMITISKQNDLLKQLKELYLSYFFN